jgi:RHS repeat-associated protein
LLCCFNFCYSIFCYSPAISVSYPYSVFLGFSQGLFVSRHDLTNPSNNRYYILDALGHTRLLLDNTGNITDTYVYDAWGNLLKGSEFNTPNPFTWNGAYGYEWLEFTGLYHVGAREYDPRTARWLQRDPIGVGGGHPNVYLYCGNEPVNAKDPSGLQQDSVTSSIRAALAQGKVKEAIELLEAAQQNKTILKLIGVILANPRTQQLLNDGVKHLDRIVQIHGGKLPDCKAFAERIFFILRDSLGAGEHTSLRAYYMEAPPGQALPLAKQGGSFANHYFIRWGDTVIDSLTGPKGQLYSEWIKRWEYVNKEAEFEKLYKCLDVTPVP